jgi:RNA polymerase-binding transcription factor DksA
MIHFSLLIAFLCKTITVNTVVCALTGRLIDKERLEVVPHTMYAVED